jgi:putative ABC transport system permease protein
VLGASVKDLFVMLNKGTVITALISFIIAVPIALYLVNAWLQNFAYRVHAGWSLFAWGGLISVATALIAVSYHTIKTAITNPVKSLRTE